MLSDKHMRNTSNKYIESAGFAILEAKNNHLRLFIACFLILKFLKNFVRLKNSRVTFCVLDEIWPNTMYFTSQTQNLKLSF